MKVCSSNTQFCAWRIPIWLSWTLKGQENGTFDISRERSFMFGITKYRGLLIGQCYIFVYGKPNMKNVPLHKDLGFMMQASSFELDRYGKAY
jgi:hypothetical protein